LDCGKKSAGFFILCQGFDGTNQRAPCHESEAVASSTQKNILTQRYATIFLDFFPAL
jgi:hypothetical protein